MRTIEYHCGKQGQDETGPEGCNTDTGGSCAWFKCHSSRNAVCDKETYKCVCQEGQCSHQGICSGQSTQGDSLEAFNSFIDLMQDVNASTTFDSLAPELAQAFAEMER